VLEAEDHRIITYKMSSATTVEKESKPVRHRDLRAR